MNKVNRDKINAEVNADLFLNKAFAVLIGFILLFISMDDKNDLIYSLIGAPFAALLFFPLTIPLSIFCSFVFKKIFKNFYKSLTQIFFITRSYS
ncbi:hypothetical protein KDD93_09165 [Campylobacter sp. faydin G-24]|uniref:Uncharacterized protein n=1 Tax=Campylobacter anatolicus TaxID=2829105 RepID=A0ABS5HKC0_9BACT|nr:hypothetical protein [Campylobacter anatolicus]MBR8464724.1 hypothetical protein [Campylobacter anatolicus]MBR8464750.1 hypothetical protein [Campylobacter anatolicus]